MTEGFKERRGAAFTDLCCSSHFTLLYTGHYTTRLSNGWDYQSVFVSRLICRVQTGFELHVSLCLCVFTSLSWTYCLQVCLLLCPTLLFLWVCLHFCSAILSLALSVYLLCLERVIMWNLIVAYHQNMRLSQCGTNRALFFFFFFFKSDSLRAEIFQVEIELFHFYYKTQTIAAHFHLY